MATYKKSSKGKSRTAKKGYNARGAKHPDPHHKAQGYGKQSTWPTSRGRVRLKYVKAHYRSTKY